MQPGMEGRESLTSLRFFLIDIWLAGFPDSSVGKELAHNVGDMGSILAWEDPLEKGKAIHSSILAWRIPWTV